MNAPLITREQGAVCLRACLRTYAFLRVVCLFCLIVFVVVCCLFAFELFHCWYESVCLFFCFACLLCFHTFVFYLQYIIYRFESVRNNSERMGGWVDGTSGHFFGVIAGGGG